MELVDRLRERFLVRQFQGGDTEAFLELVRHYERRLLYYLRRFERDPDRALDILQDVWMTAWIARTSLRAPEAFRTWVYRIAHGRVVGAIRSEMLRQRTEQNRQQIARTTEPGSKNGLETAELVHFALSRMTPDHREVLTLRFLEEMSTAEIAEVTGLPVGTVKSRLHYAISAIQAVIEEQAHAGR